jgi:hypothetical protein
LRRPRTNLYGHNVPAVKDAAANAPLTPEYWRER